MENLTNQQNTKVMSYGDWALTIFIAALPLIGLIMLLVWAFGSDTDIVKKNWAKGKLLLALIGFIIAFAFLFFFGGLAMLGALNN
jgi:uncharacterized membrane protein